MANPLAGPGRGLGAYREDGSVSLIKGFRVDKQIMFSKKLDQKVTDHEFLLESYFLSCFQAKVKIESWQTYKINRLYLK